MRLVSGSARVNCRQADIKFQHPAYRVTRRYIVAFDHPTCAKHPITNTQSTLDTCCVLCQAMTLA